MEYCGCTRDKGCNTLGCEKHDEPMGRLRYVAKKLSVALRASVIVEFHPSLELPHCHRFTQAVMDSSLSLLGSC
jgi:hypothetical protein